MRIRILAGYALLAVLAALPATTGQPPRDAACTSFCLDSGGYAMFATNYDNQNRAGLLFINKRGPYRCRPSCSPPPARHSLPVKRARSTLPQQRRRDRSSR